MKSLQTLMAGIDQRIKANAERAQAEQGALPFEAEPEAAPSIEDAADLIRAFTNWQPFILNYFEHPVTNAYTESLNSLIRVMNRLGRGYSFEALRAKILFTEGIHSNKQKRPRFERKREPEPVEMGYGLPDDAIGYGVPVMEKVRPMRAPEAYDPHKHEKREKNYGDPHDRGR